MKYYIGRSIFALVYLFFSAIIAFSIICIKDLLWLKVILLILNVALFVYIVGAVSLKDGEEALKVRIANDLERAIIVRTGEDRPLKKNEFKPYKGFLIGFTVCIPLLVLLIVHTMFILINPQDPNITAGAIASFLYMFVFAFFRIDVVTAQVAEGAAEAVSVLAPTFFYWSLLAIPVIVLAMGLGYYLGGRKIEMQQQRIKEKQRLLSGE